MSAHPIEIGYWPGVIGEVTRLHAVYYARDWHFGAFFEATVAGDMAEFIGRYNPDTDAIISSRAQNGTDGPGPLAGTITIDGHDAHGEGAHLRWFIVSSDLHTRGLGKALLSRAMEFCRERNFPKVYLWTFEGLDAARGLYERHGFELTEENPGERWGLTVTEQRFEWYGRS